MNISTNHLLYVRTDMILYRTTEGQQTRGYFLDLSSKRHEIMKKYVEKKCEKKFIVILQTRVCY